METQSTDRRCPVHKKGEPGTGNTSNHLLAQARQLSIDIKKEYHLE
jgi:hypothetical protein